jgi:hypothetical protein
VPADLKQQMIRAVIFALGYKKNDISRAESEITGLDRQRVLASL